jgi:hypothetical protein
MLTTGFCGVWGENWLLAKSLKEVCKERGLSTKGQVGCFCIRTTLINEFQGSVVCGVRVLGLLGPLKEVCKERGLSTKGQVGRFQKNTFKVQGYAVSGVRVWG